MNTAAPPASFVVAPPPPTSSWSAPVVLGLALAAALAWRFLSSRDEEKRRALDVDRLENEWRDVQPEPAAWRP